MRRRLAVRAVAKGEGRAGGLLGALGLLVLLAAPPVQAHVVYGRPSLAELVAGADVVARARILPEAGSVAGGGRPTVTAEILEVLNGEPGPGPVRFVQHGHGVAVFQPGKEVLLCLEAIEGNRELAALAENRELRWVSQQSDGDDFEMNDATRAAVLAAARGYIVAQAIVDPDDTRDAMSQLTLALLWSPDGRLAESALRDLVSRSEELLSAESLPLLESLIESPSVAVGIRIGVLAELERRGLVAGPPRWAGLLARVQPPALRAVVRAAAAHPSPPVARELIRLLEAGDEAIAAEAAVALGASGDEEAVARLVRTLHQGKRPLQMAAVRGLGRIGTPSARGALERAAREHPDEWIRRRCLAQVRRPGRAGLAESRP